MKRVWSICLFILLVIALAACSNEEFVVGTFSYAEDCAYYEEMVTDGFVNTESQVINSAEQAVELAKNEAKVRYNTIEVAFDETAAMWRVHFSDSRWDFGGDQLVYLDKNGITKKIVLGK